MESFPPKEYQCPMTIIAAVVVAAAAFIPTATVVAAAADDDDGAVSSASFAAAISWPVQSPADLLPLTGATRGLAGLISPHCFLWRYRWCWLGLRRRVLTEVYLR